ncbi:glycosyltransferase [Candidatus Pacearchaeota archaeon CG_4_9_14_3_um_filter_31_7]|nr:MAG: hypothetical protein AUJ10_02280 [Candidatus Pacearchaeota archaeon CG1_02_31_27]PIN92522.1 MAG: glycosyltransferase [Candidatus Pacearchaeota archaeon CG10_big_fil_rev_8_21_14_0_10_31_59]PIZ80388.1 MAG: glycosyltransferase [Candidatus Pacearchaeota archaeon CG_4_10_14_0_2_um_filter_31_10]PJA70559.1 MAG: glycosyltransferase [Candidatus Pacearchaeota archaeon CG_4_9_14_3_um_filter_31_7]
MVKIEISIVIPVHNEQENLNLLYERIKEILIKLKKNYEIVFVDDGSTDNSFPMLSTLAKNDGNIKIVRLRGRNGQSTALMAGSDFASGKYIITMDADLQHDPNDIPLFYQKLQDYDVVCGSRTLSQGQKISLYSKFGSWLVRKLFRIKLKDPIGGMKGYRKEVSDNIKMYAGMHRYLPLLALWKGYSVTEIAIKVRKRYKGKSKYKPIKMFTGFLDLLTIKFFTSFSSRPSHLFGTTGFVAGFLGFIILFWMTIRKLILGISIGASLPLFFLGFLLFLIGILFWFFGLIADLITFDAITSERRKNYIVKGKVNLD